ncbi:MAG TPA: trimethylamine methyltransferase family protein [Anaerolineales bacterium]|nr:trimethylamine methyltransferase family protein [Anaerolineales bacterium]
MSNQILSISNPRLKLEVLSAADVRKLHAATLQLIEKVGVKFPSRRALEIWAQAGAAVDFDTMIVRAKGELIESALKHCPPTYPLAARDPQQDLALDGNHVYLGTDGCGVEVLDLTSGIRRISCLQDVREIAWIADATEQVAFHWVPVSAQDLPAESRGLHEIKAIWENSSKHVQTESIYSAREAAAAIEMASMIAGGRQELRRRPVLSLMQCTASPLGHDGGSVEAALLAAEAGIPTGFMTMASCLTTGPATLAGNLAVGNAEVIAGTALLQLAFPGAPVFYAAAQTASDLRTGAYTGGGPEDFLFGGATNALADFYHMPLSMGSFATGAKEPNWQAGVENSLSTLMASASMADMLLGVGFLHGSRIWSYAEMMLDCEIFSIVQRMMQGIRVDDDALALGTIARVGPSGNFLTQSHTRQHMREIFVPEFMDRRPYAEWESKKDNATDWALNKARRILREHQPVPLDSVLSKEFERMIQAVETPA